MKQVYYKEFKTVDEVEKFIKDFQIKDEDIIEIKVITKDLVCIWHSQ